MVELTELTEHDIELVVDDGMKDEEEKDLDQIVENVEQRNNIKNLENKIYLLTKEKDNLNLTIVEMVSEIAEKEKQINSLKININKLSKKNQQLQVFLSHVEKLIFTLGFDIGKIKQLFKKVADVDTL